MTDEELMAIEKRNERRRCDVDQCCEGSCVHGCERACGNIAKEDVDTLLAEVRRLRTLIAEHNAGCTPECYEI